MKTEYNVFLTGEIKVSNETKKQLEPQDFYPLLLSGRHIAYRRGFYGQGIKIAVLDTGVDSTHPEIKDNIVEVLNYTDMRTGEDDSGHGTHVCGTLVGKTVGIAPQAKIVSARVLTPMGGDVNWLIAALNDISKRKDIDIVSMSLSTTFSEARWYQKEALHKAIKACTDNNIAVICASGNTGKESELYPACFQEPITVGAIDKNKNVAYFSTRSNEVDVCQVGVNVWSAKAGGGYCTMSGTSMATPIVTGIAALIASEYKIKFGKRIPEMVLYEMLKMATIDLEEAGVDSKTGAGLCTLNKNYTEVKMYIGNKNYYIDGQLQKMDTVPIIDGNNRTLVPPRFEAEARGIEVEWNFKEKSVTTRG